MNRISNLRIACMLFAALLLGAGSASLALAPQQQSGPTTVSAPKPKPQKAYCDSEKKICECGGAADCISLNGSGQCKDALKIVGDTATCTWIGPPPKPGTSMTRSPSSRLAPGAARPKPLAKFGLGTLQNAPGRPNPMPFRCHVEDKKVTGCTCTGIADCIKLDDSGLCGTKEIEDTDDGGICFR